MKRTEKAQKSMDAKFDQEELFKNKKKQKNKILKELQLRKIEDIT